jgi:hypothetical protein
MRRLLATRRSSADGRLVYILLPRLPKTAAHLSNTRSI